ncbi:hypothetical protein DYU11_20235 [Fibrisoma montanum]|uniref:SHOCT domain-containing protein n=1 Tax=Fibrisoma montanum TaxID=2305895 RepID=A0A418M3N0_9BACT|nr:SHOCT domain-containing protein [Fibrisoma montanum]RIV20382.1 hypothetical protein DYU11_20235 [Fibrisoma montanum]
MTEQQLHKMEELFDLRDQGLIDKESYERLKAKILNPKPATKRVFHQMLILRELLDSNARIEAMLSLLIGSDTQQVAAKSKKGFARTQRHRYKKLSQLTDQLKEAMQKSATYEKEYVEFNEEV